MKTRRIGTQETRWRGKRYLGRREAGTLAGCARDHTRERTRRSLGTLSPDGSPRPAPRAAGSEALRPGVHPPASPERSGPSHLLPPGAPTLCSQSRELRSLPAWRRSEEKRQQGLESVLPEGPRATGPRSEPRPSEPRPRSPAPSETHVLQWQLGQAAKLSTSPGCISGAFPSRRVSFSLHSPSLESEGPEEMYCCYSGICEVTESSVGSDAREPPSSLPC